MPTTHAVEQDVFSIFDDLKQRVLGISDVTKPPEGFSFSFLPAGRPVNADDYAKPWTPDLTLDTGAGASTADPAVLNAIARRQRNLMNLSLMVDHKLQMNGSGLVEPGASKISETWKVLLTGANAVPLPPINDPNLKAALDRATKLLVKPDPEDPESVVLTDSYLKYKDYMKKYFRAIQAYTAQYVAAMSNPITAQTWPVLGPTYKADVDGAMDDWVSFGKKDKIEEALNLLDAQGSDAATAMIASSKKIFDRYQVAAGMIAATIPYVQLFPTNWCDPAAGDDGWTTYTYDMAKARTETSAASKSWGGGGVKLGFWSFGARAKHSDSQVHEDFSSEGLSISFKYAVVDIERPWLNTILLNLSNWFVVGCKKNCISNGDANQQKPSDNEAFWLPAIPTQVIVVKDLVIKTQDAQRFAGSVKAGTSGGGSFGWGPFTIGGHYEHDSSKGTNSIEQVDGGLKIDGVQIIGWISQILPASPKVDSPNVP
nr:hypothetical protein [uncultured bacterium]